MIKDIILEGLDRTGKGTQIRNLWTFFNDNYSNGCNIIRGDKMVSDKNISLPETLMHQYLYANSINMTFQNMVHTRKTNFQGVRLYDRLHLSEIVYGSKYRKYDTMRIYKSEMAVEDFDDVYLITFIDEVDNLIKRDDGLGFTSDQKEIEDEISRFKIAHNDSYIKNKKIINISGKDITTVFNEILLFLGE